MSEFILYISDGEIKNKAQVRKAFTELKSGKYLVSIKSNKKRSLKQSAYYWGVVVPMVKDGLRDIGYNDVKTNEQAHEILKHLFLKRKIHNEINDDTIEIAGSTAELKTVEFNSFLEDIWQWSATYLNITIPEPNQQMVLYQENDLLTTTG